MLIRKWESADNRAIAQLEEECFDFPWDFEMVSSTQNQDSFLGLVAQIDNKVVGYAGAVFAFESADIALVAVKGEFRRQKIAETLLNALIDQLIAKNVTKIFLEVRYDNEPAKALYSKLGFKAVSIRKNYYEDAKDAIVMVLVK